MFGDKDMENYVDFMVSTLDDTINIQLRRLSRDKDDNLRPTLNKFLVPSWVKVNVSLVEKYTRSAKIKIEFEGYEYEFIWFLSRQKGPAILSGELYDKVKKYVYDSITDEEMFKRQKQIKFTEDFFEKLNEIKKDNGSV